MKYVVYSNVPAIITAAWLHDWFQVVTVIDGLGTLYKERTLISRKLPEKQVKGPFKEDYIQESIAPDELSIVRNIKKNRFSWR